MALEYADALKHTVVKVARQSVQSFNLSCSNLFIVFGEFMCINNVGNGHKETMTTCGFDVKICTQNVRGLNNSLKRTKVFNRFKTKADVIFVQESHSTKIVERDWKSQWGGEILFSHGTSAARGCMIMFNNT